MSSLNCNGVGSAIKRARHAALVFFLGAGALVALSACSTPISAFITACESFATAQETFEARIEAGQITSLDALDAIQVGNELGSNVCEKGVNEDGKSVNTKEAVAIVLDVVEQLYLISPE